MAYEYDSWEQGFVDKGYYPIACGVYRGEKTLNGLWFTSAGLPSNLCPSAWRDFIYALKDYCGVDEIKVEFNGNRSASIILFAKTLENNVASVAEKCREFALKNSESNPWFEITNYFPFKKDEVIVMNDDREVMSYFYFSLFGYFVRYPNDINLDNFNGLMQITQSLEHTSNVRVKKINRGIDNTLWVCGDFYSHDTNQVNDLPEWQQVNDSGNFDSNITLADGEVVMHTKVDVSREIKGIEIVAPNIRDMVWESLGQGERLSKVSFVEHYVVISNGTRLLHYCDALDNFEVFVLPEGWSFTDGISYEMYVNRKIFDGNNFDYDDPNIKVIYEILDSRGENRGKV